MSSINENNGKKTDPRELAIKLTRILVGDLQELRDYAQTLPRDASPQQPLDDETVSRIMEEGFGFLSDEELLSLSRNRMALSQLYLAIETGEEEPLAFMDAMAQRGQEMADEKGIDVKKAAMATFQAAMKKMSGRIIITAETPDGRIWPLNRIDIGACVINQGAKSMIRGQHTSDGRIAIENIPSDALIDLYAPTAIGKMIRQAPRKIAAGFLLTILLIGGIGAGGGAMYEAARLRNEYAKIRNQQRDIIRPQFELSFPRFLNEPGKIGVGLPACLQPNNSPVRTVIVRWGDGSKNTLMWDNTIPSGEKTYVAIHNYPLPQGRTMNSYTLEIDYTINDSAAGANLFDPDELIRQYKVEVTATETKVKLISEKGEAIQTANPDVTFITPSNGSQVGWRSSVRLVSQQDVQSISLLVRSRGETQEIYLQPGAASLEAGKPLDFMVELAGGRSQYIGKEFDVIAIPTRELPPDRTIFEPKDISAVHDVRLTVIKAAGLARRTDAASGVKISGDIWTSDGGVVVSQLENGRYRVLRMIQPNLLGSTIQLDLSAGEASGNLLLVVNKTQSTGIAQGQEIGALPDTAWVYEITR